MPLKKLGTPQLSLRIQIGRSTCLAGLRTSRRLLWRQFYLLTGGSAPPFVTPFEGKVECIDSHFSVQFYLNLAKHYFLNFKFEEALRDEWLTYIVKKSVKVLTFTLMSRQSYYKYLKKLYFFSLFYYP